MIVSLVFSGDLFKEKLCSSVGGWAILRGYVIDTDGNNIIVLEPSNHSSGFLVALKGHSQGHLFIIEGFVPKLWERENPRWNYNL